VIVAFTGLVDDLRNLDPAPRLAAETVAAGIVAAAGVRVQLFGGPVDLILTIVWIVVLTNSFNLLDNMDGAAGAIGAITAGAITIAAALAGQFVVSGLGAIVAGACLGFLPYNWHPAKIFMGDAGSLFLGYVLSVLAIALRFNTGRFAGVVAVMLFGLFLWAAPTTPRTG
jgi:UDP-GlcNAc:undecaprenyl-phosphate/decaprenyl-phosphate GlcNAc-1-phosphate transferase